MRIGVITISLVCSLVLTAAPGQQKKSGKLEFDHVSLTRSTRSKLGIRRTEFTGGPGSADPTHLTIKGYDLFDLIERVYGVSYFEISHDRLPPNLNYGLFIPVDITARVPQHITEAQFQRMLRNLLAREFGLKVHRETMQIPVYEMVVGENGPKLKEPDLPARTQEAHYFWTTQVTKDRTAFMQFTATNLAISGLATELSPYIRRMVIDKTGLTGKYDLVLNCGVASGFGEAEKTCETTLPDAIRQLGLKLEAKNAPIRMLVVDHCAAEWNIRMSVK